MKKQNIVFLILVIIVAVIAPLGFYYWKNNRQVETGDELSPGQGPSSDELEELDEYDRNCPVDALLFDIDNSNFSVVEVKCSKNKIYQDIEEGEDVTVEVYSEDLETGKQEFLEWLAENDLEVGEKLRVTYIHSPR